MGIEEGIIPRLFMNFIFVGSLFGLMIHEHDVHIWRHYFNFDHHFTYWRFWKGIYFFWYAFTWFIVYSALYFLLLDAILLPLLLKIFTRSVTYAAESVLQLIYGLWICGQILGTWIDWNRNVFDCMINHDCDTYFMQGLVRLMEDTCSYFRAHEYDILLDAYILKDNYCYAFFHTAPIFMMTLLSSFLAYLMMRLVNPAE